MGKKRGENLFQVFELLLYNFPNILLNVQNRFAIRVPAAPPELPAFVFSASRGSQNHVSSASRTGRRVVGIGVLASLFCFFHTRSVIGAAQAVALDFSEEIPNGETMTWSICVVRIPASKTTSLRR